MNKTVSAIYAAGSLQLLEPVILPESTKVQVQIVHPEIGSVTSYRQADSFRHCLANIHHLLNRAEANWSIDLVRQTLPNILRNDLKTLWDLCDYPQRKLCAMLELSAKHLDEKRLSLEQVAVLRAGLDLLEQDDISEPELKKYRRRLVEVGLPPTFILEQSVVQSYVDEL